MITVNTFISLFGNLAPVFMTLLLLAGVGLLLKSAFSQDALISQQRESLKELRNYVVQTVKSQVELTDQVDALRERCARLVAHQQLAKPTSSDHRRFDLAVRMLKRGVGDMKILHDLGLSDSEADLLWRLHGSPCTGEAEDLSDTTEKPEEVVNACTLDEEAELTDESAPSVTVTEEVAGNLSDDELPELTISLDVLPMDLETMGDDIVELSEPVVHAAQEEIETDVLMCESVAPHGASQAQALTAVLRLR